MPCNIFKAMSGLGTAGSGQYYIEQYVDNEVLLMMLIGGIAAMPLATLLKRLPQKFVKSTTMLSRPVAYGIPLIHIPFWAYCFCYPVWRWLEALIIRLSTSNFRDVCGV